MYNKLISLLTLVVIIWWLFYLFIYFFIINKWNIILNSNVSDYKVILYTDKIKTNLETTCKKQKCELINLAPFDYIITIQKQWYKDFKSNIKVEKKSTISFDIYLEKQIVIKQIPIENNQINNIEINNNNDKINNEVPSYNLIKLNKLRDLAKLKKSYAFFNLVDLWYFYFLENSDSTLTLFNKTDLDNTKISSFNKIKKDKLDIQKPSGANSPRKQINFHWKPCGIRIQRTRLGRQSWRERPKN